MALLVGRPILLWWFILKVSDANSVSGFKAVLDSNMGGSKIAQIVPNTSLEKDSSPVVGSVKVSDTQVKEALYFLNKSQEVVRFSYNEEISMILVTLVDVDTEEVVRQIPSEDFLAHKIAMKTMIGTILDLEA